MNVAYVFSTPNASFILEKMIVPQLEEGRHGATVVGMSVASPISTRRCPAPRSTR